MGHIDISPKPIKEKEDVKPVIIMRELLKGKEIELDGNVFKWRNDQLFFRRKTSMFSSTDFPLSEFIKACDRLPDKVVNEKINELPHR